MCIRDRLGAIDSPSNFNLAPGETARLIDHNRPKAYIYDCEIKETAHKALELCEYKPVSYTHLFW